ncbi:MAG TPA: MFS transporter [Candidatus Limnocylindria bacterium]|nr:MFS transporter [Candidatus Limnocylindria bacterium]
MQDSALRRIAIAFVAFNVAEWATWIAMLVYAYEQGGVVATGLVAVLQLVPAAIFAPFGATIADRYPRAHVLSIAYAAQAATMGATAAALGFGAPVWLVYALAAAAATSITLTRPAQNGLLPALSKTPESLTAANSVLATIENASLLVAPAFAGVLLALSGPGFVYASMGAGLVVAALVVLPVRSPAQSPMVDVARALDARRAIQVLATDHRALLLVALLAVQALQVGALDVLFVALAMDALDIGETGVGILNSALGLGGALGALGAGALAMRSSLPRWVAVGILLWGGGLAIASSLPQAGLVFALVATAGAGRGLMDVAARTLLQRVAPRDALTRVFGLLEGLSMGGLALGAALAPFLVERFGISAALLAVGVLLPATLVLTLRPLLRLEALAPRHPRALGLLRAIPFFAPLPTLSLGRIADALERVNAKAGEAILRQGEAGDHFYVIDEGVVSVTVDGRPVRELGPGDFFGEIALLRDVPRTASVTAREAVQLYSLRREEFLSAVHSRPASAHAADAIARSRAP